MNDLIKVDFSAERPTVSARDLHAFLEVRTAYKDWFPRMCEYGFSEGTDFCSILSESTGGRPAHDAALTIDMAKEICMLQRNEKGKQARLYFIQLEKDWNSPEKVMARALRIADAKIADLTERNRELAESAATLKDAADYCGRILVSPDTLTVSQIAADYDLSARKLNEILHEAGIQRKVNGQWILYKEWMGYGLTESVTVPITGKDGKPGAKMSTRWTQLGRRLIDMVLHRRGYFTKEQDKAMRRALAIMSGEDKEGGVGNGNV